MSKVNGFCVRNEPYVGQTNFDKFYENRTIKKAVKKTGEGEDDFILIDKEIIDKVDIKKSIAAQLPDAGIEAFIRPYIQSGEPLPDIHFDDVNKTPIQDFTNMPEDLAGAAAFGQQADALFRSLDPRLTEGQKLPDFLANLTPEKLKAYYEKVLGRQVRPVVPGKEEKIEPGKEEK